MIVVIFVKWSINWDERMALGTCGYDANGIYGGCSLSSSSTCYTYGARSTCNANTLLVDMCPLNYGDGYSVSPANALSNIHF
jgi:hypothetical protein